MKALPKRFDIQRAAAHRAVARAQLVGLQAVKNAQDLVRVAAHIQVVDADVLDDVVGVDDEGRAQGHTGRHITHTQHVHQAALAVGKAPVAELVQVFVVTPPAEFAELVVGAATHQHGVTLFELPRQLVEGHDLGRANEGEVLGPEIDDLPLAGKALLGQGLEGRDAVFLVLVEAGLDADDAERFELLTDGLHGGVP